MNGGEKVFPAQCGMNSQSLKNAIKQIRTITSGREAEAGDYLRGRQTFLFRKAYNDKNKTKGKGQDTTMLVRRNEIGLRKYKCGGKINQ